MEKLNKFKREADGNDEEVVIRCVMPTFEKLREEHKNLEEINVLMASLAFNELKD